MNPHNNSQIVSRTEWLTARRALLANEKQLTRQRDALAAERRKLPMVRLEQDYVFAGEHGPVTLHNLFGSHPQLIAYHFMFDPAWDEGCPSCSHFADNFALLPPHLAARDTAFVVVSRAPIGNIAAFKSRMGWTFPWVSSAGNSFNLDFHVTLDETVGSTEYNFTPAAELKARGKIWMDELPGLSVFWREGEALFHTYSTYARGLDELLNTYNFLDLTPLGRHEEGLQWAQQWVRHRDRYGSDGEKCHASP